MATLFSYDFESGLPSGTAMTTANSPFAGLVQAGWTFSNAHLLASGGGTLNGRCAPTAATSFANVPNNSWAGKPVQYLRTYLYAEALPAARIAIYTPRDSAGGLLAELRLGPNGEIQLRNSATTQVAVSPDGVIAAGTHCRIEHSYNNTAGTQQVKVFSGANVHGSTPDYDSGAIATVAAGLATSFQIGVLNATTAVLHFDDIAVDDANWPGSVITNAAPIADAGVDQANVEPWWTVTLTGTASDTDGTIASRSWTQTGGTPAVTLSGTGVSRTFEAPATVAGTTLTFAFAATDDDGATITDTVTVTVLPAAERILIGGLWVPCRLRLV